jgi:DNA-binding transcriptional ArsR family regulator
MMPANPQLDQIFFALSDSTRRAILVRLAEGSATIGELAKPFNISKPAVTKHMKILERADLIDRVVQGRQHTCALSTSALKTAEDWINFHRKFWESRFDSLEKLLKEQ